MGTSAGGSVGSTATVGATVAGGGVAPPSVSESPHAAIARLKANNREMDAAQARLRTVNLKYVNQLTCVQSKQIRRASIDRILPKCQSAQGGRAIAS